MILVLETLTVLIFGLTFIAVSVMHWLVFLIYHFSHYYLPTANSLIHLQLILKFYHTLLDSWGKMNKSGETFLLPASEQNKSKYFFTFWSGVVDHVGGSWLIR